ncbi:4-hydroxy-tetrahydrodipicolinate reductase [Rhodopirellula sp. P2]|uniref:4-hydroxy-tetrahydrodipicolinate reductase n=1 Tax=Rhodopirellula sp. P2 TaxID=2127060 RepID=UPI0023680C8D|nr:4-hydroxy-tetrahydrodipicolinate reductase [Rhodopirellula sp. P2]WDQ16894.1 4-hydroxy-tetrahydrodipicolinate reductase [Rhodopirellula sp. P2]
MADSTGPISLTVHGAAGRMGRRVVALGLADSNFHLVGAIDHAQSDHLGKDAGAVAGEAPSGIEISSNWPTLGDQTGPQAVVDFSLPEALDDCIAHCVKVGSPLVVATTGLSDEQKQRLSEAAASIPIVWAPSMSLAVNLSMKIAEQITAALKDVSGGLDVEILERHHRFKADAPSGTALKFGELIAGQLGESTTHVHGREGHTGARTREEIGYHAIRVGDNPGEHTIVFGMLGEKIELNVAASNRDCYASGALAAAKWLIQENKGPGLYSMFDVLGMSDN